MGQLERRQVVLSALASAKTPTPIRQLAALARASTRSIRYDLDELQPWLAARRVRLIRRPRVGVWLEGSKADLEQLRRRFPEATLLVSDTYFSQAERRALALARLLGSSREVRVSDLAQLLRVSHSTVRRQLAPMDSWLEARSLQLRRGHGRLHVEGAEVARRQALFELLQEWLQEKDIYPRATPREQPTVGLLILAQMGADSIGDLRSAIEYAEQKAALPLTATQRTGLLLWLAIAKARASSAPNLVLPAEVVERIAGSEEYRFTQILLVHLRGHFPDPEEATFLALQLRDLRLNSGNPLQPAPFDSERSTEQLALLFARRAGQLLGVALDTDHHFLAGLESHLARALQRGSLGLGAHNPLLLEIRARFPGVFAAARQAVAVHPRLANLPEAEVGHLAAYLAAFLERIVPTVSEPLRALLVSEHGVAASQLLAALLAKHVPDLVVCGSAPPYAVDQEVARTRADLVVSTRPVTVRTVPVFLVQPLPTASDLAEFRLRLRSLHRAAPAPSPLPSSDPNAGGAPPLSLRDVLTSQTIALDVPVTDWRDAVRAAGELLVRAGAVETSYVESMVRNVEEIGPYIVVAPGIAMPHARPQDGVLRIGLSLVRLARPVVFLDRVDNPVDLVLAFAAVDNQSHLNVMSELADLLSDAGYVERIRSAREVDEVLEVVRLVSRSQQLRPD